MRNVRVPGRPEREPRYERIGRGYAGTRREDPRLAERIRRELGKARTVLNVGAGAGSYEPRDLHVVAIEPSDVTAEYLPEVAELDRRIFPPIDDLVRWLGGAVEVEPIEIPADTPDWTLGSFWAHPERVLDVEARNATSGFARMDPAVVERVVRAVERDLRTGEWDRRHGELRDLASLDVGLRLVVGTGQDH